MDFQDKVTFNVTFNATDEDAKRVQSILNKTFWRPQQVPEPPQYLIVAVTLFYVVIFLLGVFGNIIVMVVIFANKNMKSTVNMFIVNLCVADLLVLLICMPPTLVELHTKEVWYLGEFMCKLVPFLEFVVSSASIFTILSISIERYRVVIHPLSVNTESTWVFVRMIIVIWILAIATSAPIIPITVFKKSRLLDGTPIQVCRIPVQKDWHKIYFIMNSALIYFLPCFALTFLYFKLCKKLVPKKTLDDTTIELDRRSLNEKRRLRWQVINIIITIVIVFFVCHFPYRVISIWMMLESIPNLVKLGLETYLNIIYSARVILYLNHALNPIIYNFVSTKFRMAFRFLFNRKRRNSSYYLYERKKSKDSVKKKLSNSSVRFKSNILRDQIENESKPSTSSSSSRQKMNDFSPLYENVCSNEDKVIFIGEIDHHGHLTHTEYRKRHLEEIRTKKHEDVNTSPAIRFHVETKEGCVLAITVESLFQPKQTNVGIVNA